MENDKETKNILFRAKDWSNQKRTALILGLSNLNYDANSKAKEEAKLIPLDIPDDKLKEMIELDGKLIGVTTGYWTLDRMTAGLCGGDLDVISAVSSGGKTLLCVNMMARQMALGHKVAFITLEMSKTSIARRLFSIMGEKNYRAVMWDKPLLVQEREKISYQSIKYAVEQAKNWGAEVFYIDHLHYFSREMMDPTNGLGAITQEFKMLAKIYDIPIVLISQMRKTEGRRPTGEDLRGSALIRQDADVVLILDKNEDVVRSKDENPNNVRVTLDKNRDRLIWKIESEVLLWKYGLDLREDDYDINLDAKWDVTGQARGKNQKAVNFIE